MKTNILLVVIVLASVANAISQPVITTLPLDQTNYIGTVAVLTVVATGAEPVSYQWQKYSTNFQNLSDATASLITINGEPTLASPTNAVLILDRVQTYDSADYRVVVTDATGMTNSAMIHLYVALPPMLFVSQTAPGLVTLSWQNPNPVPPAPLNDNLLGIWPWTFGEPSQVNMILLGSEALNPPAGSLTGWHWIAVGTSDISHVTLPVGSCSQFFRLVAPDELEADFEYNLITCREPWPSDVKVQASKACFADYLMSAPIEDLRPNELVDEAFSIANDLDSNDPILQAEGNLLEHIHITP